MGARVKGGGVKLRQYGSSWKNYLEKHGSLFWRWHELQYEDQRTYTL